VPEQRKPVSGLTPYGTRILVRTEEPESVTPGGIVLADTAKEKPTKGLVLRVGWGAYDTMHGCIMPIIQITKGDRIFFRHYAGNEITHQGEKLRLIDASDVLAVFNDEEEPPIK